MTWAVTLQQVSSPQGYFVCIAQCLTAILTNPHSSWDWMLAASPTNSSDAWHRIVAAPAKLLL